MAEEKIFSLALKVRSCSVKAVKDALDAHGFLDKSIKITPSPTDRGSFIVPLRELCGLELNVDRQQSDNGLRDLLLSIGLQEHLNNVSSFVKTTSDCHLTEEGLSQPMVCHTEKRANVSRLDAAINQWLGPLPVAVKARFESKMSPGKNISYAVYSPMLLLAPSSFANYFLDEEISQYLPQLYECLCKSFDVTHIAMNAPIPPSTLTGNSNPTPNIMRSPSGLTPLHGDFGASLSAKDIPTSSDFVSAFWCSAKQNGILQTWAPRYSMFSRGNISEKARILNLAQQQSSVPCETTPDITYTAENSTAVDLYAGIGYFAFSYVKAGLARVLCWEINPWSVEALRRGALMNKWKVVIVRESEENEAVSQKIDEGDPRLVVFEENNDKAAKRIKALLSHQVPLHHIAPIRHINCGYLPSSQDSWQTAVDTLDEYAGGWIHVHENIGKSDLKAREAEICEIFRSLTADKFALPNTNHPAGACHISCEHLERVKSYAPGVFHCVLDIHVKTTY